MKKRINKIYQKYYIFFHKILIDIKLNQLLNIFYQYSRHSINGIYNEYLNLIMYPYIQNIIDSFCKNKQYNFNNWIIKFQDLLES